MSEEFRRAVRLGDMKTIEKLLPKVALDKPFEKTGMLPLFEAAVVGRGEVIKRLLEAGADPACRDEEDGESALMLVCGNASLKSVEALVEGGADVNEADQYGRTPLSEAAGEEKADAVKVIKFLLDAGAKVDPGLRLSPLICAARTGTVKSLQALLDAGADPNYLSPVFGTALHGAVMKKRADVVKLLIEAGVDPNTPTPNEFGRESERGKTALQIAQDNKYKKVVKVLDEVLGKPAAPSKAPTVKESWKTLKKWLRKHDPEMHGSLAKAAKAKDFSRLETETGMTLPDEFKDCYKVHNGQGEEAEECLVPPLDEYEPGYELMSLEGCLDAWQMLKELLDDGEFANNKANPETGVEAQWWHPAWLPFATDGGGDYVCLDLAPTKQGKVGQVILFGHDSEHRPRLGPTFAEWFADVVDQIQNQD